MVNAINQERDDFADKIVLFFKYRVQSSELNLNLTQFRHYFYKI